MATSEQYAQWIVDNQDKKGTPDFETVAAAYKASKSAPIETAKEQPKEKTWGDVAGSAAIHLIPSLGNLASGLGHAVMHPLDTAKTGIDLAAGGLQNILPESVVNAVNSIDPNAAEAKKAQELASVVGQQYKKDYGSISGFKDKLSSDPAGVAADLATVLTAGGGVVSKVPTLGNIGKSIVKAGAAIDPLSLTVKGVSAAAPYVGGKIADVIGGMGTHTGGESLRQAALSGLEGGSKERSLIENMRGNVPASDVVDYAKTALDQIKKDRGAAYRSDMNALSKDRSVIDMTPIVKAAHDAFNIDDFKGVSLNPKTAELQTEIGEIVAKWQGMNPAEFHTPEGMDALKRMLGNVRDGTQYGTPQRVVADRAYNAVKGEIVKQAPAYAKTMKDYEQASILTKEIEHQLSLGNKASADTSLRKLQSLMRNNVNTNYGARLESADALKNAGADDLMAKIAGQSLNAWTPRGLGNAVAGGLGMGAYALGGSGLAIPTLAAQSPRLMGESALKAGQVARLLKQGKGSIDDIIQSLGGNSAIAGNYAYQLGNKDQLAEQLRRK